MTSLAVRSSVAAKGPGGRSSVSGVVATVFGATGFLGRYVVQQLARGGSQVVIPYRCLEDEYRHLKVMGDLGQIVPIPCDIRNQSSIAAAISKSNVVINLIGRDYETRNFSFDDINVDTPHRIAEAVKEEGGVSRLVHLSCMGASPSSTSKHFRTKALGEDLLLSSFPGATVLRSAPMVGQEDRVLNHWALAAKKFGTVPIIGNGENKWQLIHVQDVASAVTSAALDDGSSMGNIYELGGPQSKTVNQWVDLVFDTIREYKSVVHIPKPVAQLFTAPREMLLRRVPFPLYSPNMFTSDFIKTLECNLEVSENALTIADLGIVPRRLEGVAIEYMYMYRTGGPQYGETAGVKVSGAGF